MAIPTTARRWIAIAAAAIATVATPAFADDAAAPSDAIWQRVRQGLFQSRPIDADASSVVELDAPSRAEDAATPVATPWQDVITSQIQAFRDHDAPAALSYAGMGFQATFPTPEAFFIAIISSGYAPIMESRSHSFGEFRMVGEASVAQQVKFVGTNQDLYEAIYMLTEEESGWRVQGVQLLKQPGIGI